MINEFVIFLGRPLLDLFLPELKYEFFSISSFFLFAQILQKSKPVLQLKQVAELHLAQLLTFFFAHNIQ